MNANSFRSRRTLRSLAEQVVTLGHRILAESAETHGSAEPRENLVNGYCSDDRAWELAWGKPIPRRPCEEME